MRVPAPISAALLGALLSVASCTEPPWPTPADETAALEMGAAAADELSSTLIRHLTTALDSAGPSGAIAFCSSEALVLTAQAAGVASGLEIKRTSDRVRNPANLPDGLERAALDYFAGQEGSEGGLPRAWIQAEGDTAMRYYRPLVVNELCVQCHGPVGALAPEVLGALADRYPEDRATGYLPGDFRGLIRVRIPRAALEAKGP